MTAPVLEAVAWSVSALQRLWPDVSSPEVTPISRGGSDRDFYRLRWNGRSALLMHYRMERRENGYYAPIGSFLKDIGVAVPEIYDHDAGRGFLVMEDLGDDDLWSYRSAPWNIRQRLYEKVLDVVRVLHDYPLSSFPKESVPLMEEFDAALYRWERNYFLEHFVGNVCRINLSAAQASALESELEALAHRLASGRASLIHRDFQSQNIMICRGEPVLIDFQGMRPGNPFYDLASLLYDPYVALTEEERDSLLHHHYEVIGQPMHWAPFRQQFRNGAAQRLMQALGAYGFLGLTKGKRAFLGHIANGLRNLEEATRNAGNLPCLHDLAESCRTTLARTSMADSMANSP